MTASAQLQRSPTSTVVTQIPRFTPIAGGLTRLSRRLGPVRNFPTTLQMNGHSVNVVGAPELILLVDLIRAPEGEYRLRFVHDVICQLNLEHEGSRCTVNVNIVSSRMTPSTEASIVEGSRRQPWLDLAEADDTVCSLLSSIAVRERFSASIMEFISRWVTEYSLRAIMHLRDEEVSAVLQSRDKRLYLAVIAYVDTVPGAGAELIGKHLRTALVAPEEMSAFLARQPKPEKRAHTDFERTQEIRSERSKRD